jgi:hypothetical protein
MKKSKIEYFNQFLRTLSLKILKSLNTHECKEFVIFKDIPLKEDEIKDVLNNDYMPIVARLGALNKGGFHNELIMISILFLNEKNDDRLYDENIDISAEDFSMLLFYLCNSLLATKQFILCKTYIELLQKIVIAYPNDFHPPEDIIESMDFTCFKHINNY